MSVTTSKFSEEPRLKLFQGGEFSQSVNFAMTVNTFYTIGTVDVSDLSPDKVVIISYGHADYSTTDGSFEYLVLPNVSNLGFFYYTSTDIAGFGQGYQYENGLINFGIFLDDVTDRTPIAPFPTARIFYNVFYY